MGMFCVDLMTALVLFFVYYGTHYARNLFEEFIWEIYLNFLDHHPRSYTDFGEALLNILLIMYVLIFYMLYRLRDYLRAKYEEQTKKHRHNEQLFKLENDYLKQLRDHGIYLEDFEYM